MKSALLLSAALIICSKCLVYAQVQEKQNADTLTQTSENSKKALYLGVENTLFISVDIDPGDKITYQIDQGEIIHRNDSIFAWVYHIGTATITVSRYGSDGKLKEEGRAEFPVTSLPAPYVTLEGLAGGIFNLDVAQSHPLLYLKFPYEFVKLGYKVVSFSLFPGDDFAKMSPVPDHFGDVVPLADIMKVLDPYYKGNQNSTNRVITNFSKVGYAQHFTIANIKLRDRKGKTYMAPNLVFAVKY